MMGLDDEAMEGMMKQLKSSIRMSIDGGPESGLADSALEGLKKLLHERNRDTRVQHEELAKEQQQAEVEGRATQQQREKGGRRGTATPTRRGGRRGKATTSTRTGRSNKGGRPAARARQGGQRDGGTITHASEE